MTAKVKRILKEAKNDSDFLNDFVIVEGKSEVPGFFSDEMHEHLFVAYYNGWYLGKHGTEKTKEKFK